MKKVLAILGSPKKNGNCAKMLNCAINAAKLKGYEVDFVDLYDKNIAYCKGCMACKKTRKCIIGDDLQLIGEKLISCDLVILVSPTYFENVSAPVKNMFDRLMGTVMDDNNSLVPKPLLRKEQKYIIMTTCTTPAPFDKLAHQSSGTLKAMKEFFAVSGMKCGGKVVFAGTKSKTEIPRRVALKIDRKIKI